MADETGAPSPETVQPSPAEAHYAARTQPTQSAKPEVIPEPSTVDAPKAEEAKEPDAKTEPEDGEDKKASDAKDTGEGEDDDDKAEQPKRNRKSARERIDELTRDKRELERRLSALEERRPQSRDDAKPETKTDAPKRPKQEDFENYDAYLEAMIDWKADQKLARKDVERQAEAREREQRSAQEQSAQRYRDSAEKARTKYDDFDDVVTDPSLPITTTMAQIITDAENPAELAYWLGQNPQEARRIAPLPPTKAAIELGKIEARLSAPAEKPKPAPKVAPKTETNAPPPPKTVAPGGSRTAKRLEELSQSDYYAKRTAQLEGRR